jgi:hypothetical protein
MNDLFGIKVVLAAAAYLSNILELGVYPWDQNCKHCLKIGDIKKE